ncbi:PRTRC system protein E, partial [Deinococcus sp. 12RED42]|uniref:PRTRC system protein E n=2 Tax=Deinococcus TaxID=1298 RepID=UPI001E579F1A
IATLAAPVHSGLIAQLAGLLADGGELTFQLLRVGGDVTIGIFPKPHPGEAAPVPFMLTETPDWMDANLVTAMQGYAGARRDAFSVAQQAAQRQQAANKKAADKPAPTPAKAKTSVLTLKAAEATTLKGTLGGKDVPLVVGKNDVPQGTLEIVATHPAFGEVKKTVATHANKEHDFTEQQGARVTVNVTPQSAALEATKGDTVIALHQGIEILLAPGTWVVNAQAADHATANQTISVKAGKPQVIEMTLKEEQRLF